MLFCTTSIHSLYASLTSILYSIFFFIISKKYHYAYKYHANYSKIQITIWILILYLVTSNFNFYNKTASYYQNFISFIFFNKSVPDYQKFFDRNTPRDYELAQFTKSHLKPKDTLFIWGNNAQVYKLTGILPLGRFTVKYHMKANKQTMKETEQIIIIKKPTLIIITSQEDSFPFALTNYTQKFNIKGSLIYERLFKKIKSDRIISAYAQISTILTIITISYTTFFYNRLPPLLPYSISCLGVMLG